MSKPVLKFDNGETWSRLWDEIQTCRNVAFVAKGLMPDFLHQRLEMASEEAQRILRDEVGVEDDEPRGHTNLDRERGEAMWAPDREQLAYDKEKGI